MYTENPSDHDVIDRIGVTANPEETEVSLFPAVLLASSKDELMVVGVLVIKGMDLNIAAGGICD